MTANRILRQNGRWIRVGINGTVLRTLVRVADRNAATPAERCDIAEARTTLAYLLMELRDFGPEIAGEAAMRRRRWLVLTRNLVGDNEAMLSLAHACDPDLTADRVRLELEFYDRAQGHRANRD